MKGTAQQPTPAARTESRAVSHTAPFPGNKNALPAVLHRMNRRNFVKLAGLGGVVFTSGLARGAGTYGSSQDEFFFVLAGAVRAGAARQRSEEHTSELQSRR